MVKLVVAAILASISCGIAGSYLVSRRLVFLGGGITHASFGGIGLGFYLGINPILSALFFSICSALGVEYVSQKKQAKADTIIAVMWALGMSIGILFMSINSGYTPSLMPFLFGNITSVGWFDIAGLSFACFVFVVFLWLYYYPILFHSFDLNFLVASGRNTSWINYFAMALVGIIMILNVRAVGIILLMALLTIPQMTANLFFQRFKQQIYASIIFSLAGTLGGVYASWVFNLPSGVSIVLIQISIYLTAWTVMNLKKTTLDRNLKLIPSKVTSQKHNYSSKAPEL